MRAESWSKEEEESGRGVVVEEPYLRMDWEETAGGGATARTTVEAVTLFQNRFIRHLTGPQPYSKTVLNHTVKILFLHFVSRLLASLLPAIISMSAFHSPVNT